MRSKISTTIAVLAMLTLAAGGQTNAPRDFKVGFQKFWQLGLPDVTGGTYGKLQVMQAPENYGEGSSSRLEYLGEGQSLKGNAWRVRDLGGGTNLYVLNATRALPVMDQEAYRKWMERQQSQPEAAAWAMGAGFTPPVAVGSWKPADLGKDVGVLLKLVHESDARGLGGMLRHDPNVAAELLLFAAQIFRVGLTNEANRIADRLFKLNPNPGKLVAAGLGRMANAEYGTTYAQFLRNGDWAAFHAALSAVLAKFPTGWREGVGVRRLQTLVKARLDRADLPPLAGPGLSAEDQALARELAAQRPSRGESQSAHYLMNTPWIIQLPPRSVAATNDVVFRICRRGMASVPLLTALLKDDTLTCRERGSMSGSSHGYSSDDEESGAEKVFRSLRRPATRGEIARRLLQVVLPVSDRQTQQMLEMGRMSDDAFAGDIAAWYAENGKKTRDELARLYLEKGNNSQQSAALRQMLRGKGVEQNSAEIERVLLDLAKNAENPPYFMNEYVTARGAQASNFVEQVAGIYGVTNAPAAQTSTRAARRNSSNVQFVKQLRALTHTSSLRDLLAQLSSGTQSVMRVQQEFWQQIAREPPAAAVTVMLNAAQAAKDPDTRAMLAGMLSAVNLMRAQQREEGGFEDDPFAGAAAPTPMAAAKLDPAQHATIWKTLLADRGGTARSVRESAAWAIEALYGEAATPLGIGGRPNRNAELYRVIPALGEQGVDLLVARAEARLSGQAPKELPDASKVNAAGRRKLVDDILKSSDLKAALAALGLDERLALIETGRTNTTLNVKLRPYANRIVAVTVAPEFKTAADLAARLANKALNRDTVSAVLETCRALTRDGVQPACVITRKGNLAGTAVNIAKTAPAVGGGEMDEMAAMGMFMPGMMGGGTNAADTVGRVNGWLMGGSHNATASWTAVEDGARAAVSAGKDVAVADRLAAAAELELRAWIAAQGKAEQERFWTELDAVLAKANAFIAVSAGFDGLPAGKGGKSK